MQKFFLSLVALVIMGSVSAQQLHFMSQYLQHNPMYNPAAAGMGRQDVVGMSYRSMWSSFPGNPKTFMVYGDTRWEKMNSGVAAYLYRDVTGPTNRTGLQLAYSYHVKTGENSKLGIGLELRGLQYAIDRSKIIDALGSDPVLVDGTNSKFKLDAGAGVYYTNGKLSLGGAVSQLIQSQLAFADVANATVRAKLYRHYAFMGNYEIQTGDNIRLIPNFLLRVIPNAPTELDLGCRVDYQDKIWWSLNWRTRQFWSIQAGFRIMERVNLSYAYDYYNAPFSDYNRGNNAHELGLRFDVGRYKNSGLIQY
jgi:type IX secretion system PorP/SprF family membrane protein